MFGLSPLRLMGLGALGGAVLGAFLAAIFFVKIAIPDTEARVAARVTKSVTTERDQACLITTQKATSVAVEAARRHQSEAAAAALEDFRKRSTARQTADAERIRKLEQRNADYSRTLEKLGRSCPLDRATLEWLRGGSAAPEPRPAGGGGGGAQGAGLSRCRPNVRSASCTRRS